MKTYHNIKMVKQRAINDTACQCYYITYVTIGVAQSSKLSCRSFP